MRPASLIISLLLVAALLAPGFLAAQFTDNFSDGEFFTDPAWSGETDKFTAVSGQLELNDPAQMGSAYLVTPSSASRNAVWEFFHSYAGNPSTSNRAEFYLMSDQANLSGPLNGYYLRIGEQSGTTDQLKLFRRTGANSTEILATPAGSALNGSGEVSIRIRVERDDLGNFTVYADNEGDTAFVQLGAVNDNTHGFSLFSGVSVAYTSTRSQGFFFFDDFRVTGEGVTDSVPPALIQFDVVSANALELRFSEALEAVSAEDATNYLVDGGIGFPESATLLGADAVRLEFAAAFTSGQEYELSVSGLADLSGNTAPCSRVILYSTKRWSRASTTWW